MRVYQFHHSRSLRARRISRPPGASSPGGLAFRRDGPRGAQAAGVPAGLPRPGRLGAGRPDGGGCAGVPGRGVGGGCAAFAVLELGGSASAVGLVLASRSLPLVLSLLAGGVVADRVSRRAVMVTADLVRLGSQGAIATLLIGGWAQVWMLAVLSGVSGAASGFFNPASTGLLPALVAPGDLQQANGLRATVMAGGEIAGPAVAGGLVATAGACWAIGIDALTFAASA